MGTQLERRRFGDTDRTWSAAEFKRILELERENDGYLQAFHLARFAGLPIHECFCIDTAIDWQPLLENTITIKGKGGKIRTVPISQQIISALEKCLETTPTGSKILVSDDAPTDKAIIQLQ